MATSPEKASKARFFDAIVTDYDAHRPTYPDALIDRACVIAGLGAGDPVLEVGPGTGHLTIALAARHLAITAVEPGANLIAVARAKAPEVTFVHATLEDAELAPSGFSAVFAASSIHWPDPDVSWRRVAEMLAPGGTLVLISYFGLAAPDDDQAEQLAIMRAVAPEVFGSFPALRTAEQITAEAHRDRDNVSLAWQPFTLNDVARDYAADLFAPAELEIAVELIDQTATETVAVLGTMSSFARLTDAQRAAIATGLEDLERRNGRPLRTTRGCLLMTARRR